jgi:hypothetical protein
MNRLRLTDKRLKAENNSHGKAAENTWLSLMAFDGGGWRLTWGDVFGQCSRRGQAK